MKTLRDLVRDYFDAVDEVRETERVGLGATRRMKSALLQREAAEERLRKAVGK